MKLLRSVISQDEVAQWQRNASRGIHAKTELLTVIRAGVGWRKERGIEIQVPRSARLWVPL